MILYYNVLHGIMDSVMSLWPNPSSMFPLAMELNSNSVMCPPRKGVPITIYHNIVNDFSNSCPFLVKWAFWGYSKKIKLPNSSALCGKASAARLELFSGCLFHRQRWGCVNGCILYISIYEYVYNCVCGYYVKYIITYISMIDWLYIPYIHVCMYASKKVSEWVSK